MSKITQERKDEWIARLENPTSRQAFGDLKVGDAYCAIGHLNPNGLVASKLLDQDEIDRILDLNDRQRKSLPEIAIWIKENVSVVDDN